jgi:cytosine deaminase
MNGAFALARTPRYGLHQARVPASLLAEPVEKRDGEGLALVDLIVDDGKIAAITPSGLGETPAELPRLALGGAIVLPLFVDAHTHLDKGNIWPRAPNPDGTFAGALSTVARDREAHWSAGDVEARMDFALQCAFAHGTGAIRTHIDSAGWQTRISWPVFAAVRERWQGRIELQASPLFGIDDAFDAEHMRAVEDMIDAHGSNLLGAVTSMIPRLGEALDALFALAARKGWDLDFHVDESADPAAASLAAIARIALKHRFAGEILVGHCCSLALQDDSAQTIDLVARAGISVVSLPMCNMYLQDRQAGRTPRWRGVTALHELKAAGVRTMIASDNTRDPFYAYGDLDMLEVWREGVRILQLDHPIEPWSQAVFSAPARTMRLDGAGVLKVEGAADLILTRARNFTELFARPQADRIVLRGGAPINARPPDYSALDPLAALRPSL